MHPLAEKFWARVEIADGCWLWRGKRTSRGYGVLYAGAGREVYAHRLSLEIHQGALLLGENACHSCDNPPCVNPSHLFRGSQQDNLRDMNAKGRRRNQHADRMSCSRGHHYTDANTRRDKRGRRVCRTCQRDAMRRHRHPEMQEGAA